MKLQPSRISIRSLLLATLALALLTSCGLIPTPGQLRTHAAYARFKELCKNAAGIRIYRSVEDVEGIVLLKVRPAAGDREWADPMWPGAAFARDSTGDNYINTFLFYEQPPRNGNAIRPVTPTDRGGLDSRPSDYPGYRYVDVVDEGTGKRERYSLALKPRPTSKIGWVDTVLEHRLAPAEGPRYGVTFEDHVIPEERALGLASSTVKVLDLQTNEVLGEMTVYAWTPAKPNSANPSLWLTAYRCGAGFGSTNVSRLFVDQILHPRKEK